MNGVIKRPLESEIAEKLGKAETAADSAKLDGQVADYYKATVMTAKGSLLNSDESAITGHGTAMIILHPGRIAEIVFSIKITNAPSETETNVFNFGLNRDILTNKYGVPRITPIEGGVCRFIKDRAINDNMTEYGGTFQTYIQFWKPARIYDVSGDAGAWPTRMFAVGDRIEGVCYGTY